MFGEFTKQKRELTFGIITLVIVALFIWAMLWSFGFLILRFNEALEGAAVEESQVLKFNLQEFGELKLTR